jgi:hypothetical protein
MAENVADGRLGIDIEQKKKINSDQEQEVAQGKGKMQRGRMTGRLGRKKFSFSCSQ